jgi:hypothetical protein
LAHDHDSPENAHTHVDDSRLAKNVELRVPAHPEPRWPMIHRPALRWVAQLDRRIRRLDHPEQGAFMSLTNALEYQFEAGAIPEVVHHLLRALFAFASAMGVSPADLGTSCDPGEVLDLIRPRPRQRPRPPR